MLRLSRQSLLALICANAALATPTSFSDRILSRDLEVRQDNATKCPATYTSRNGLNFTSYCEQNNPFNDAIIENGFGKSFQTNTYPECMEHCSRYWGNGEGCFGVVWVESAGACWIRNSNVSTASLVPLAGHYSALVDRKDMKGYDTACPNTDLSINTLPGVSGMQYTTHCGKVIGGNDLCFSGYPCLPSPYSGFYHAATLEDCMAICVDQHPLCRSVSWNPGLEIGFANCWPKTGTDAGFGDPVKNTGVFHSAEITQFDQVDTKCPLRPSYTTEYSRDENQSGVMFDIHCGQLNQGTNITSLHVQNITACMEACASSDKACRAILFDSTLQGGYKNCYLQNTTSIITNQSFSTYAVIHNIDVPSSAPTPAPSANDDTSLSSKAWIAGPAVGGVVALAAIGFAIFWWRRRKSAKSAGADKDGHAMGNAGYGPAPAYSPAEIDTRHSYYDAHAAAEVDGHGTSEMPDSTKYAHNHGPKSEAQELAA
ncbi:PAN-1 domain containing protein [Pyrenophora tritici-repentis]|nr:PAN-1 domain containing protein [Pyrenophora tritici-repentis]